MGSVSVFSGGFACAVFWLSEVGDVGLAGDELVGVAICPRGCSYKKRLICFRKSGLGGSIIWAGGTGGSGQLALTSLKPLAQPESVAIEISNSAMQILGCSQLLLREFIGHPL